MGIDRDNKFYANLAAVRLGIAPEVSYYIQPEGYLITRYITGHPIPPEEICQPENLRLVSETIRQIHGMGDIPGILNVFNVIRNYTVTVRYYQVDFPNNYYWLLTVY